MNERELEHLFLRYRERGDVEALAQVFDRSAPELMLLAQHLVREPSEAEDLLQETFLSAIERAEQWKSELRLMPWLVGILVIAARRRARERSRGPDPARLNSPSELAPETAASAKEFRAEVERALAALPLEERELLTQYLLDERKPHEIAGERGLAPGTVRMRIQRALESLRRLLPVGAALGSAALITGSRSQAQIRAAVLERARERSLEFASAASGSLLAVGLPLVLAAAVLGALAFLIPQPTPAGGSTSAALAQAPASVLEPRDPKLVSLEAPQDEHPADPHGAQTASARTTVPPPPPVFRIGTPPVEGEFMALPDAPSIARKRVHLSLVCAGKPVPKVSVMRLFADAGFEGSVTDTQGRIDLEFVPLPEIAFCFDSPTCKLRYWTLAPEQFVDGSEFELVLEPCPPPTHVRLVSSQKFPENLCARFVPLALLGDRRPADQQELLRDLPKTLCGPECRVRGVAPDGTLQENVRAGSYWVMLFSSRPQASWNQAPMLDAAFECDVGGVPSLELAVDTRYGGRLSLDVLGPWDSEHDVHVSVDDGRGGTRELTFMLHQASNGSFSSTAVCRATQGALSDIIPPGEHELVFTSHGKELERRRVRIEPGATLKLSIEP